MVMLINGGEGNGEPWKSSPSRTTGLSEGSFREINGEIQSTGLSDGNGSAVRNGEGRVRWQC